MFDWKSEYELKIPTIDAQHRRWLELLNELAIACEQGQYSSAVIRTIGKLEAYVKLHFAYEEQLLDSLMYSEREEHRHQHKALVRTLAGLRRRIESGTGPMASELMQWMHGWLVQHILVEDAEYAEFVRKKKVA